MTPVDFYAAASASLPAWSRPPVPEDVRPPRSGSASGSREQRQLPHDAASALGAVALPAGQLNVLPSMGATKGERHAVIKLGRSIVVLATQCLGRPHPANLATPAVSREQFGPIDRLILNARLARPLTVALAAGLPSRVSSKAGGRAEDATLVPVFRREQSAATATLPFAPVALIVSSRYPVGICPVPCLSAFIGARSFGAARLEFRAASYASRQWFCRLGARCEEADPRTVPLRILGRPTPTDEAAATSFTRKRWARPHRSPLALSRTVRSLMFGRIAAHGTL